MYVAMIVNHPKIDGRKCNIARTMPEAARFVGRPTVSAVPNALYSELESDHGVCDADVTCTRCRAESNSKS